jgi:hypothetical protein
MYSRFTYFALLFCCFLLLSTPDSWAGNDPFGETDLVYLDSVEAAAGEDVIVRLNFTNDEALSGVSVPLTYPVEYLTLKQISWAGSRVEYLNTRLVSPVDIAQADGHFVVAVQKIFEAPIPPGDGLFCTFTFSLSDTASVGAKAVIDSLFRPPGSELLLVEAASATEIHPDFKTGAVTVGKINTPPTFVGLTDQYVLEGEQVTLIVTAVDANEDAVGLAVTSKPSGASFADNGDGTGSFTWTPGFVGPSSADGSPYTAGFWAGDGDLFTEQSIDLFVVNVNRNPEIGEISDVTITAGDELVIEAAAVDPDFESLVWSVETDLAGTVLEQGDPAVFTWQSAVTDAGSVEVNLVATDPQGAADTASVSVHISSAALYTLALDTVEVDLGSTVEAGLNLINLVPVAGFDVLVTCDPSVAALNSVTNEGTRAADFEYFSAELKAGGTPGLVRIVGLVNQQVGPISSVLAPGEGPVAEFSITVTSGLDYANQSIPFRFKFDALGQADANTLVDSLGGQIERAEITFVSGRINIGSLGTIRIGDINLNGTAYEVGDVVRFTNYFIDPLEYGFSLLQYANSDIDQDGIVATISDLVALIKAVVDGAQTSGRLSAIGEEERASLVVGRSNDATEIRYESTVDLGALLLTVESPNGLKASDIVVLAENMTTVTSERDNGVTLLLYSMNGHRLPAGAEKLLIVGVSDEVSVRSVQTGTVDGRLLDMSVASIGNVLPDAFSLYQNYPNPFNPETTIEFDIPSAGPVRLAVYNVLGQLVRTLIDGELDPGSHSIRWDGTDKTGNSVSSGIYLYRLETPDASAARKMLLMK